MAIPLKSLPIGSVVKDKDTLYLGVPIEFLVVAKNHVSYPTNSVSLITKKIITHRPFDQREPTNPLSFGSYGQLDNGRDKYGNNQYHISNIRNWLNSDVVNWYKKQHTYDEPPIQELLDEPGFMRNISYALKKNILLTSLRTAKDKNDGGGYTNHSDFVFLPAASALQPPSSSNNVVDGEGELEYFEGFAIARKAATPTTESLNQINFRPFTITADMKNSYMTRSVSTVGSGSGGSSNQNIVKDGKAGSSFANYYRGVRPMMNVSDGLMVEDSPDADGAYVIITNDSPTAILTTANERTFYESDTFPISGTAQDTNAGDVVMVKYKINNGTARTIASPVSTGAEFPFNRSLIFKEGKLFDGTTAVTTALAEGTQHVLTVWAEDDKGGKSAEVTRTFYVVPNRPPKITVDPITPKSDMIDSDSFEIKGTVNNPDANGVKVHYKIGNSAFNEVYTSDGAGGEYSFRISLSQLVVGANSLTVRATDHFGAVDAKTITITKTGNVIPLKQAVTRYKMLPPNGTAKGVLLWIEREVGDLVVDARISMTSAGEPEHFVPMTKNKTAFVSEGIEEDEYLLDAGADKSNIILEITQKRTSTASEKGITKITGVFA
ncbi:hypothetical protein SporoP37_00525 [Sporosarcina sp. P37]|uniref:DUF6273 domain-containing protein n=1 Tax=unclassified Sporosarcina TaxID=2647733 RepID=UPI000A17C31E|nr:MULTISPECIES: DUF6273 domain-containing protein [unclassified Sporosarcina]ARK23322.1 hypothetical protein SporoP37_00525 [Sporosarcina sp. P37]PID19575.1 hypothetical protein CSV62_03480 [Sporosarcina sp. P35]